MILTIWRHGQAASAARDSDRELTETGIDDISFGSDQFHQQCNLRDLPLPSQILYSRWLRTSETADIIGRQLPQATLAPDEALIPGRRVQAVDQLLAGLPGGGPDHLILVSHQPLVSGLVDYYLGQPGKVAPLAPGGFAVLQMGVAGAGCAELLFSAQPPEYRAQA